MDPVDQSDIVDAANGVPKCENCNSVSLVFCLQCDFYYCADHNRIHVRKPNMRSHERVDAKEISEFISRLSCSDHSHDFENDSQSKFIYVNRETLGLDFGKKLSDISERGDIPYLQCAFIGPSGCGKSTMIRLLSNDNVLPIPAVLGTVDPTSSDINAYNASLDGEDNAFIFADCEGTGGSMSNTMLMNDLKINDDANLSLNEETKGQSGEEIINEPTQNEDLKKFLDAREPFVSNSFPRLLYLFSDVLVFMFTGEQRERETVLDALIHYGSSASAGSVNQSIRPHLIIVFNQSTTTNLDDFDVDKSTESYLNNQSSKTHKLRCLYQTISIIHIPRASGTTMLTSKTQIDKLRKTIQDKIRINKSFKMNKPEFTRSKVLGYILKAMELFNHNQNTKIDFFNLITLEDQTNTNASYIFKFANIIAESKFSEGSIYEHLSFLLARTILELGIIHAYKKHCLRNGEIDPKIGKSDSNFSNQFKSILNQVNDMLIDHMPCGSEFDCEELNKKVICQVRKKNHQNTHESTEVLKLEISKNQESFLRAMGIKNGMPTKITWDGEFEQPTYFTSLLESSEEQLRTPPKDLETDAITHIIKDIDFKTVCNSCLLEFPSEVRPGCGHFACYYCCIESPDICPICNIESYWIDKSIPKNCALRILCLEGGNFIKSTSQCTIIGEIEKKLYGIPIGQLFDIISAIGSGAIIGLAFITKNQNSTKVYKMIEDFSDYTSSMKEILAKCGIVIPSLYDRLSQTLVNKMSKDLTDYIPMLNMYETEMDCKFLCSTIKYNTIDPESPQTGSYNIPNQDISNGPACDLVTLLFVDSESSLGHQANHHPIKFTLNEYNRYWKINNEDSGNSIEFENKKQKIDLVISLGNGYFDSSSMSGPSMEWNESVNLNSKSINNMIRIDPTISKETLYNDSKKKMISAISKETSNYLKTNEVKLEFEKLVNSLLAQIFYVEIKPREANRKQVNGIIRSRIPNKLPKEIIDQIRFEPLESFSVHSHEGLPEDYKFTLKADQFNYQEFGLPFSIDNIETYNSFTLSIQCNLKCKDSELPSSQLISNCPIQF